MRVVEYSRTSRGCSFVYSEKGADIQGEIFKNSQKKYFANTCPACGVLSGDFFLHPEPGAPFFPTTEDEAQNLFITESPLSNDIKVSASCGMGVGDLILSHANKIR